ncbi:MAG: hypothetical protein PHO89_10115 [Methylacidiphilaceae bacterium]|nr:hypothetical protein [Candidatus Methylacidiphilaceae bacterium]
MDARDGRWSGIERRLECLKTHQQFLYGIDGKGRFFGKRYEEAIREEASLDGWYLLETTLPAQKAAPETVLRHYTGLPHVPKPLESWIDRLGIRSLFRNPPTWATA